MFRFFAAAILSCFLAIGHLPAQAPSFISGHYSGTAFDSATLVNEIVGALSLYNEGYFGQQSVIANVEGGYIWDGHYVFDRSGFGLGNAITQYISAEGVTGEADFHATMVGHVLAGTGYVDGGSLSYVGIGMAPFAELWSGAIATGFSSENIGSFSATTKSMLAPYRTFFRGIEGRKADVINSSWGDDASLANSVEVATIDALARENPTVAFVVAAGNSGTAAVSAPGSGYNNITVGSLGGAAFLTPSEFSSCGPVEFYNPETGVTLYGVRAAVDIAGPGEQDFLAAYLGSTGSLQYLPEITQDPSPDDLYFVNQDGTSFASPTVAGGIALLKDAARGAYALAEEAFDTRIVKSVLMAGSRETEGWDNGQATGPDNIVRTTQALDYATGSGALDLDGAADIYLRAGATQDVSGLGGGSIASRGWDFGEVAFGGSNDYLFDNPFAEEIELTISLNWFAGQSLDAETDLGSALSFANLNLEVWLVTDGVFATLVAESASLYNNTEFLRVDLPAGVTYGLRVTFLGLIYDVTDSVESETYGLAWRSQTIPEPSTWLLFALAAILVFLFRRSIRS